MIDLDKGIAESSSKPEPESITKSITAMDPLINIYTSGTTGLPKAVIIKHIRHAFASIAAIYAIDLGAEDRVYVYLPLYHTAGGQLGIAATMFCGATSVIRKKFSASNFWKDCVKYDITATQYIGTLTRFSQFCQRIPYKFHRIL